MRLGLASALACLCLTGCARAVTEAQGAPPGPGDAATGRLILKTFITEMQLAAGPAGIRRVLLYPNNAPATSIPLEIDVSEKTKGAYGYAEGRYVQIRARSSRLHGLYVLDWSRTSIQEQPQRNTELVYFSKGPEHEPSMRIGQRFVEYTQPPFGDRTAAPAVSMQQLTISKLENGARGGLRVTLASEDGGGTKIVDVPSSDVDSIPGLIPLADDDVAKALDAKYAGRDVYPIGDFAPTCTFADGSARILTTEETTPLRVRHIVRLSGVSVHWDLGPMILRNLDAGQNYLFVDPLLVIYDGAPVDGALTSPPFEGLGCASGSDEIADDWDFGRSLAPTAFLSNNPDLSDAQRTAIQRHTVILGMSKAMVAASVGYPSVFGTAEKIMTLDTWEYALPPPSSFTVRFKDGKVADYDPPTFGP